MMSCWSVRGREFSLSVRCFTAAPAVYCTRCKIHIRPPMKPGDMPRMSADDHKVLLKCSILTPLSLRNYGSSRSPSPSMSATLAGRCKRWMRITTVTDASRGTGCELYPEGGGRGLSGNRVYTKLLQHSSSAIIAISTNMRRLYSGNTAVPSLCGNNPEATHVLSETFLGETDVFGDSYLLD